MTLTLFQVDAFTDEPFAGNPAAVCVLPKPRDATWMQKVATEMNLSETAFLVQRGETAFDLRWFTPAAEVDLCGHATLASAHLIWEQHYVAPDQPISFHTLSGVLTTEHHLGQIEMNFPAEPEVPLLHPPSELVEALGAVPTYVGKNRLDYLVVLDDEAAVRALAPDLGLLEALGMRGFIVTARAFGQPYDFVSRYFAPSYGVPEDPVTGSAHCCLGPYWSQRLGRNDLVGYQASSRGGTVHVRVGLDDRVILGGQAVTVMRAELLV